jgi:hypothetical protein
MKKSKSDTYPTSHVTCNLSSYANKLLEESIIRSKRSKKKEAEIRLADHLDRYALIPKPECQYDRENIEYPSSHVTCFLAPAENELLDNAIVDSPSSKKEEATKRLTEHLIEFISISELGNATKR